MPRIIIRQKPEVVCADAIAELYFDGELIDTLSIPSGDTDSFNIDCSTLLNAVRVESDEFSHQHTGTFVLIGEENAKPKYEKDGDPDRVIRYNGTRWILEKLGGGAHTHDAAIGDEDFPWLANWDDAFLLVSQATIGTYCANGAYAYYRLVDTDGNVLFTGSIPSGDTADIVAPDTDLEINGTPEGSFTAGSTIDLQLTDGVNPVTPDSVSVVGNTVTVEVAAGGGLDPDAQAYITANTAITSSGDITAIDMFFKTLKNDGIYANIHAMYLPIWQSATANKWNLKDPRDLDAAFRLTFFGGITYDSDGMVGNGTNGYANTHYNASIEANINSAHLSFYSQTNLARNEVEIGSWLTSPSQHIFMINLRVGNNNQDNYMFDNSFMSGISTTDSRGFYIGNRATANNKTFWERNTKKGNQNIAPTIIPNADVYLLAANRNNTMYQPCQKKCSFASIGEGFTDTQIVRFHNAVQALMTHFGINQ
jgi:hypothetical protein